jgi:hypothetical protein
MASGTISFPQSNSSGKYIRGKIEWTSTANNSANTSSVTCNLYVRKGDTTKKLTTPTSGTWSYSLNINGGVSSGTVQADVLEDWVLVGTSTHYNIGHDNDGSKSITISGSVTAPTGTSFAGHTTSGSGTATFDKIPRASAISAAANVTLGNICNIKWTPASASFRYKLKFAIGSWSYTTAAIHPNRTSLYTYDGYTIPLEVAAQIAKSTGTMTVTLYTYSDAGATTQVGSADSETFTVTVPNSSVTQPTVSMTLTPVSSLSSAFAGLYIQGKTKVKATLSATGKYGATISTYSMKVDGNTYDSSKSYTSDFMPEYGTKTVYGYATDSRGFTGSTSKEIEVIAYQDPKVESASAVRCDKNGNVSESGTYLKISAKRSYNKVMSGGVQKNFCLIRFRYKLESAASYSAWTTILAKNSLGSDEVITGALLGGVLSAQSTYLVQVQAVDDIGESTPSTITVSTEKVYWHRDGARNALGLGKYNEKDNAIDSAWDIHMNGKKVTGLPTPVSDTDAVPLGLLQDYVVEQGTSGGWTYRKWKSGCVEMWSIIRAIHHNGSILGGELEYPFALTGTIYGIGTLNSAGGNSGGALPWNLKLTYGTELCGAWVHNPGTVGFAVDSTVDVSVYIVGRWK